jgi:rhodanese-related sulfurtransferase
VTADVTLAAALAAGTALAGEQQSVMDTRLVLEYVKGLSDDVANAEERQERWKQRAEADAARRIAAAEAAEASRAAAAGVVRAAAAERRAAELAEQRAAGVNVEQLAAAAAAAEEQQRQQAQEAAAAPSPSPTPSGLPGVSHDELAAALRARAVVALDVRSARDAEWGRIKGAIPAPYVVTTGTTLAPETRPNPAFLEAACKALGPPGAAARPAVLYGPGVPLDSDTKERFVSKEVFVSIAPNGAATIDGEVRRWPGVV